MVCHLTADEDCAAIKSVDDSFVDVQRPFRGREGGREGTGRPKPRATPPFLGAALRSVTNSIFPAAISNKLFLAWQIGIKRFDAVSFSVLPYLFPKQLQTVIRPTYTAGWQKCPFEME